jgi:hypothetical protein
MTPLMNCSGASGTERLKIPCANECRQCEVRAQLAFTPSQPVVFEVLVDRNTPLKMRRQE